MSFPIIATEKKNKFLDLTAARSALVCANVNTAALQSSDWQIVTYEAKSVALEDFLKQ